MNIEKKSKRFYWKIENFGLYFLTQTEPLKSPPFQIARINPDVSFRLALYKQIRKRDVRVVCFLIVSEISRASTTVKIDGVVMLKMANETKSSYYSELYCTKSYGKHFTYRNNSMV
ncbi:hypothetical protein TNCV_2197451 [Trichonephila clavipes]|nr:hypothetical protein TNCV_2197451 [Trichonephila clavipes]